MFWQRLAGLQLCSKKWRPITLNVFISMATRSTTSLYVSWEDFRRIRNDEDENRKAELASVRQSLQSFQQQLETRLARLEQQVAESNERKAETPQTMANLRNSTLRNPILRIRPLVTYRPERGIVDPDPKLFPKNAKEFYSLKDPTTDRQRRMLNYLISFYDIPYDSGASDDDSDTSGGDQDFRGPELAVSMLEGILGLNEDNFIRFRIRAEELRSRQTTGTVKWPLHEPDGGNSRQTTVVDTNRAGSQRNGVDYSTLAVRQRSDDQDPTFTAAPQLFSPFSGQSDQARVGWGLRSTPSDRRPSIHNLDAHGVQARRDNAALEQRRIERMNAVMSFESGSPTH
ncbi:hypothetical protein LZ32DRAFT_622888 [Colletotrichum eremochloae]|nr:hypothetical protein LZ32DRAFT_622888 [Colletotrichum eremochloae]